MCHSYRTSAGWEAVWGIVDLGLLHTGQHSRGSRGTGNSLLLIL